MFRSQDILRPFLLACNHHDASVKMISITLQAMQRLVQRDALTAADMPNIMRVMLIQVEREGAQPESHLKLLQTLLLLLTTPNIVLPESALSQALTVCFALTNMPNPSTANTAAATVRQLISVVFDRVQVTPHLENKKQAEELASAAFKRGWAISCSMNGGDDDDSSGHDSRRYASCCL
jgi:hypothetical protein